MKRIFTLCCLWVALSASACNTGDSSPYVDEWASPPVSVREQSGAAGQITTSSIQPIAQTDSIAYTGTIDETQSLQTRLERETYDELDGILNQMRECDSANDCALIYAACPLSCGTAVAKQWALDAVTEAEASLQYYFESGGKSCYADCGTVGVTCKEARCTTCGSYNGWLDANCVIPPNVPTYSTRYR